MATPPFLMLISSTNLTGAFIECVTDLSDVTVLLGKYLKLVPCRASLDDIEDDVDLIVIFLRGHNSLLCLTLKMNCERRPKYGVKESDNE